MPERVPLTAPGAPQPVGPYSQVIKLGRMLYVSGQLPLDPASGELSAPDIEGQTRRVLDNLTAILEFAGAGAVSVVKTTVYLTSLVDAELMNEVYAEYFAFEPPARSMVEVAALPKGALLEVEAIACLPESDLV